MKKKKPSIEELEKAGRKKGAEEEVKKKFQTYKERHKYRLNFLNELEKLYDYLVSGDVSGKDKAIIIGTLLYFINPFDFIPDITPILGFMDDFALVAFVYKYMAERAKKYLKKNDK